MSRAKTPEKESEVVDVSSEQQSAHTDMQARIKELEAKILAGEEAALARVCKAMGVTAGEIKEKEASAPAPVKMIRMFVHYPVNVNGIQYQGHVEVPYDTFMVISEALGKRRMRLLGELTGNNYMLKELTSGGWAPVKTGQINDLGERIS